MKKLIHVFFLTQCLVFSSNISIAQELMLYDGYGFTGESIEVPFSRRGNGMEMNFEGRVLNNKISSVKFGNRRDFYLELFDAADGSNFFKILFADCSDLRQLDFDNKVSLIKYVYGSAGGTLAFVNKNDPVALHVLFLNPEGAGYRFYGSSDNKLNYFKVPEGFAAILWENADDAHDRLYKGFGEVFVIYGQGQGASWPKQTVGPKIKNKVSYIKIVPVDKVFENL